MLLAALCGCFTLIAPAAPEADSATQVRAIGDVRTGDKLKADHSAAERDTSLGPVDPPTWRQLIIRAPKVDGHCDIVLLRPLWWLEQRGAQVGGTVFIDVVECGVSGEVEVLAINPCPPLKPGKGAVVTGTFRHTSAQVIDLYVEGQAEPIGVTRNHRFWSAERLEFVAAGELRVGERLEDLAGQPCVVRIEACEKPKEVYNLEVHGAHIYLVTRQGVLVHNSGANPCAAPISDPSRLLPGPSQGELNAIRGNAFENQVRASLRTAQGGDLVSPSGVTTRPDLPAGQRFGVTDIKDVRSLAQSPQLRAMAESAAASGRPFSLIISENTLTISRPLQQSIFRLGGSIFEYNPATDTFRTVILRGNTVVR